MRVVLKPLPVLYACQGCPRHGQAARELAEALDACAEGCALQWLARHGVTADGHYVLEPGAAPIQ